MSDHPVQPVNHFADRSPFHAGEKQLQHHIGLADPVETMGRRMVRSFMPEQHRLFFAQLPYIVVGAVDEHGWPWASLLTGQPGFIASANAHTLRINTSLSLDNPLTAGIQPHAPVGLLGIELATRRRNRMNGRVSQLTPDSFTLQVDQSMGNCPKYIQPRTLQWLDTAPSHTAPAVHFTTLDAGNRAVIQQADTCFVASYTQPRNRPEVEGVDVSHRGGMPGFVHVTANTLTIPDFAGNNVFMTLGNFVHMPRAGLLFIDFATGDLLMLTGRVELLLDGAPDVAALNGAQRGWRFSLERGVKLPAALPFRLQLK